MRLSERLKRTVTVKPAAASGVYEATDRLYRFDDSRAFPVRAVIQPMAAETDVKIYGETPEARLYMLCDGDETLEAGMGVCVDAESGAPCDYRIAEMPKTYPGHREINLAFIPAEMRG